MIFTAGNLITIRTDCILTDVGYRKGNERYCVLTGTLVVLVAT